MDPRSDLPLGPVPERGDDSGASPTESNPVVPSEPVAPVVSAAPGTPVDTILGRASASPGEATLEPLEGVEGSSAATQPVGPGTSRRRWAIAGGVVVAVVALSIAAAFTLSSAGQSSLTAGAVPKSSLYFATLRTDFPGDQQQKVADLLGHFPGFADQSLLAQSLGETLDKVVRAASNGKHDYQKEIQPWLGGEIGMAITRGPTPGEQDSGGALFVIQAKDTAKGEAWLRGLVAEGSGITAGPDQTYDGVTLHTYTGAAGGSQPSMTAAEAVTGQLMLFGDLKSVKAGLDAKAQGGLDTTDQYKAAARSIAGDHLATVYVNIKDYLQTQVTAAASASPGLASLLPADLMARVPGWIWMTVRAESASLVVDAAMPRASGTPTTSDRVSVLAPKLPSSTVAVIEVHDLGTVLKSALDQLSAEPATKDAANQVRTGLAFLGGVDRFLGWMGDAALVVTRDASSVGGGLVVQAKDAATASDFISQIKGLFVIGGSSTGLTTQDETYQGTTITMIDMTEAVAATGQTATLPPGTRIRFALASRGDVVILGVGDAFAKQVLDAKAGASLADSASYKAALDAAGSSNAGQGYVDVGSIMQALEPLLTAQSGSRYTADVKPYVQHLQAIAFATRSGDPTVSRYIVSVK